MSDDTTFVHDAGADSEQYRAIFEATSDGLVINDPETGLVLEANPAFCRMHGYDQMVGMHPTQFTHPDSHYLFEEYKRAAAAGRQLRWRCRHTRRDGSSFDVEVVGRAFTYDGKPAMLGVVRDVTEQVRGEELLEERVQERTRELSTLLHVSRKVASTLDLEELLKVILEQIRVVADYDRASFSVLEGDTLEVRSTALSGERQEGLSPGARVDVTRTPDLLRLAQSGEPVIIANVNDNSDIARQFRRAGGAGEGVCSWIGIPLMSRGKIMGLLSLCQPTPNFYTAQHARLAHAFADQAAIAIENARLYEHAEERMRELRTLLEVSGRVTSTLDLQPLLELILDQLRTVVEYDRAALLIPREDKFEVVASAGGSRLTMGMRVIIPAPALWDRLAAGETVVIDDAQGNSEAAAAYRSVVGPESTSEMRSWIGVPLVVKDRLIGVLGIGRGEACAYGEREAKLAAALGQQAAIAIENARLYEQAQQLAATEERQRLARELHDSVSQAIYGIALGARTARTLQDRNPADAVEPMEYVISLAEAALAEMRALIFELRPESLANEGLVAAISKRVEATCMRYGIAVDWSPPDEPDVPLAAKEATYRIVQEALHNIVKHSKATRAGVVLKADPQALSFRVSDNGVGFDPGQSFSGHLGLQSMRERLQGLGGVLQIESELNSGTSVSGSIPLT